MVANIKKIETLQVFRGMAALSVVIFHTSRGVRDFIEPLPFGLSSIFKYGYLGVDFFFVLSGFIIMSSHINDSKSISSLKDYAVKRLVRIYPPYWIILIILFLSYTFLPSLSQGNRNNINLLSSFFLLPDKNFPLLIVAWTLIHEMIFYLIFCLFFISNRLFLSFLFIWLLSISALMFLHEINLSRVQVYVLSPLNLEFLFGVGSAYLLRNDVNLKTFYILILSCLLVVLLCFGTGNFKVLFGLVFVLFVFFAVLIERERKINFPVFIILIGDASYSIYLIHNPLISLTSRLVSKFNEYASWQMGFFIGVVVSVVTGIVFHLMVEKPLLKFLRKKTSKNIVVESKQ